MKIHNILASLIFAGTVFGCNHNSNPNPSSLLFKDQLSQNTITKLQDQTVYLENKSGAGTGVVIYQDNNFAYIITCRHCTLDRDNKPVDTIMVYPSVHAGYKNTNPIGYFAKVIERSSEDVDLALIQIDLQISPRYAFISSLQERPLLPVGSKTYHLGCPYRLSAGLTEGNIFNYVHRKDNFMIYATAAIDGGSSGGGLYDSQGNLIGIAQITYHAKIGGFIYVNDICKWIKTTQYKFILSGK